MGNSQSERTLYDKLEVDRTANSEEITRAFRKLAFKYHPDKNPDDPEAEAKFKDINHAKTILLDERRRRIYDSNGEMGLKMAEQLGEENLDLYMCMDSKLMKCCCISLFCLTCFYCGCFCCCCFCCRCCCGLFAPKNPYDNSKPEDYIITEEPVGQSGAISEDDQDEPKEDDPLMPPNHPTVAYTAADLLMTPNQPVAADPLVTPDQPTTADPAPRNQTDQTSRAETDPLSHTTISPLLHFDTVPADAKDNLLD